MDLYARSNADILNPPVSWWGRLKHIGPSLILTANIVGSGELIVTTSLGAKAGFVTLWVVIISCVAKVAIQFEFGKHAINSGESTLTAFNKLPGPRFRGTNWSIWLWLLIKTFQMVHYGGIIGGVALALNIAFPGVSVLAWTLMVGLATLILTVLGKYRFLENFSVTLVGLFSLFTIFCLIMLQYTPYQLEWQNILSGVQLGMPAGAFGLVLAMFAITGVGADEIISYPYWCLEKGYARHTGPYINGPEWTTRAKGWIKVMYLDGILSLVIYTTTTLAFYLLGAAILHDQGRVPEGYDMIRTISQIYTESLGSGAMFVFLSGAIITLFSTLFVASVSSTRMFTDAFAQIGLLDFSDEAIRNQWFRALGIIVPVIWTISFLVIDLPALMIVAGAISLALLLIIVVAAAFHFRYKRLDKSLKPGLLYDIFLWLSLIAITGVGLRSFISIF